MSMPPRCQHVKVNGVQRDSPALRRKTRCYFHERHHQEYLRVQLDRQRRAQVVEFPPLEDANAIQVSIMEVLRMVLTGAMDRKAAGTVLYGLQLASCNLARTNFRPKMAEEVVTHPSQLRECPIGYTPWDESDWKEQARKHPQDEPFPYETERAAALAKIEQEEKEEQEKQAQQEKEEQAKPAQPQKAAKAAAQPEVSPSALPPKIGPASLTAGENFSPGISTAG